MSHSAAPETAAKKDNLLGICHAIGEDFGFNPFLLRVSLAVAIIFSPEWTLAAYAAMGVAVLASRLLVRTPRKAKPQPSAATAVIPVPIEDGRELALAA
ncbi:PspC domain-containing protein [Sphingomonas abietis]|uniref:PspC domain-containing protein n=1 Tax=Sphingomonas abietis TaxID=3012344 RepID=A0ABY7NNC6_9SPHN|nr:PspC domain-containing protein [Sphingomonas abietis]WBO21419.1 PspC domain-containing protein [Sphingomonas abietis]